MPENKKKTRGNLAVMGRLVGLVKPLAPVMVAAVLLGVAGFLCAIFITVLGAYALLDSILPGMPISLGTVCLLLPVLAIHIQGDDGTALVFLGIGLVMVFAGGISGWLVAGGLAAAGGGAALLLKLRPGLLKGYQAKRIFAVLDPENPALADIAYQQNKGAMAIGTGGLTGTGLWGEHVFVPNSWNDFIFSYLANAMGFVGAVTVLLLLLGISVRILLAALQSTDALGRYLCVGIFAALFWQCIINLGMNLQVLPVIGVTLPFFSAGGSSVVMMYLCVGIVLSVGMNTRRSKLEMQQIV